MRTRVLLSACLLALGLIAHAPDALARKKVKVTVPVDVGAGPALHMLTGDIADDQLFHYGLKLSVKAIIDQELIRKHKKKIPKKYRKLALGIKEARISPSIFIPDTLHISPSKNAQLYGIGWRPIQLGFPLIRKPFRFALSAGALLSYIYIHEELTEAHPERTTHFLRIGADLNADLEIPFGKSFLISVGWSSQFYIPQQLGAGVFDFSTNKDSVWHIGQAYLMLHFRFPYTTSF